MKKKITSVLLAAMMVSTMFLASCGGTNAPATTDEGTTESVTTETEANTSTETEADSSSLKLAEDQMLRINLASEPPSLDPGTSTDTVSTIILNACYDGLVRINKDGRALEGSGVAESWEVSEDLLTYTFHLKDTKWSDGTPVTANDFEYAWERVLAPETGSAYSFFLYYIKGAEAYNKGEGTLEDVAIKSLDEKTLQVTLNTPTEYFASLTARPTYMPLNKAAAEKTGMNYGADIANMVFNGPFTITEWQHEQSITLTKNENYWDKETVKLSGIKGDMISDLNTPINLFETGELDAIGVPTEYLAKYREDPGFKRLTRASSWYLQFNMKNDFLANAKIRKALSMSIHRKAFVDNILNNGSKVAPGLVPYGMPGKKSEEGDFRAQSGLVDPIDIAAGDEVAAEAKKLFEEGLAEIGKTREDFEAEVTYLTDEGDLPKKFAQAIQQMWHKTLDVTVGIEATTFKVRLDKERKGDYALSFSGWSGDYNDPMTFMDMWVTGGEYNRAYWSNAEYDALIEKAQTTTGDERMQAMIDAEKILMEETPISMLYFPSRNVVEKSYVHDIYRFPVALDAEYKWTYLTEK